MVAPMRRFLLALLFVAVPAAGQAPLPAAAQPWQPTAPYVIAGQDEAGYRNWYAASPRHPVYVKAFNDYLTTWGVGGIVPTWQLLRTASDWMKCGAAPFEVPPSQDWPNIVQTLRYVREQVIPAVGPVEPVSVYRNPLLNHCAGGANESAHRFMQAVDLVPLLPTRREDLIRRLCNAHARTGAPYGVGLGFYVGLRFHIDARKYRKWGSGNGPEAAACLSEVTVTQAPAGPLSTTEAAPPK
jgi:hypothetical protein